MNWKDIVKDSELIYASTQEDIGFKTWSLKKTKCSISFYEEYQINDIDKIICSIIDKNDSKIDEERLATILGFNIVDDFDRKIKRYADKAELEVFRTIVKPVADWGLVEQYKKDYKLTELGEKALKEGKKYKFYSGQIELLENQNIKPVNSFDNKYFPFYSTLGIHSKVSNKKEIKYEDIEVKDVFSKTDCDLIRRHILQSKEELTIYKSEESKLFDFGSCQVDIRLFKHHNDYLPVIFYNSIICETATKLLNNIDNITEKKKKIEWALYLKLVKDPDATLDFETVIPFKDLLELDSLIEDKRLVWSDNNLFNFIAENANADQWYKISNHCSVDVLKLHIDECSNKLDWTTLSLRFDDNFIVQHPTTYPWNYEVLATKENINIDIIKTLLLIPELKEKEWDWEVIMPQLDFGFIKSNIDRVDFELSELTKSNNSEVQSLISAYPYKNWDWGYVSNEYDLWYILDNIKELGEYINLQKILNRAFSSSEYSEMFCNSLDFERTIIEARENKLSSFSPNMSDYNWSDSLIDLLERTKYLTWESGKIILGFECNPYFQWTYANFQKYHSKITTERGFDFLSSKIKNTNLVLDFEKFNWNWNLISTNKDLINNSDFIQRFKTKLDWSLLLPKISGETFESIFNNTNILNFLNLHPENWSLITLKPSKEFILKHIDLDWDWNVLTRRFCKTIKIESLGNERWVDKWDWKYLTKNLSLDDVLEKLDLYIERWDWDYISSSATKEFILDYLPKYNNFWNWEILLKEQIEECDLSIQELYKIATCISIFDVDFNNKLWSILTHKYSLDRLIELIEQTRAFDAFNWDYQYLYNLDDFNARKYLRDYSESINWELFSKSNSLNKALRHDKSLFSYSVWINDILKLLRNKNYDWDFKALSVLDSINWNDTVLKIKTKLWDWDYLSEFSGCFKKGKGFSGRFSIFSENMNFSVFSKRVDSEITEALISKTIKKDWDWTAISHNSSIILSLSFVQNNSSKEWDWKHLSTRKDIVFDNDIFEKLINKDWDWNEISQRDDIIFSENLILKLKSKNLDWLLVSKNKSFVPSAKVLSILKGQDLDWKSISENSNLSKNVLWDYKELLDWVIVTSNSKLIKISDKEVLQKYAEYLNWNYISKSNNFKTSIENLLLFKTRVNWEHINEREDLNITEKHLVHFAKELNWSKASNSQYINFTEELIEKYREFWDWQALKHNPQFYEYLDTTLRKYKNEFNCVTFIEHFNSRTPYIYHFTHLFNAIDIIKSRKILSRNKAEGKFANAAGNLVARRDTAHNFARFYFRPQTPTQFYNECLGHDSESGYMKTWKYWDGDWVHCSKWKSYYTQARNLGLPKCPIPVFFKFDLKEVLMKMQNKSFYSTGNMQTNWSQVKKVVQDPNSLNVSHLYSDVNDFDNYKQYSQQEFLVEEEFDFTTLDSFEIICYDKEYANLLKYQLGDDPICEKINSNGSGIYHRGNRELNLLQNDSVIRIESKYRGDAYLSIRGEGLSEIEILEIDTIQKETNTELIAYPSVKFTKTDKPIEVHFVDTSIGKRDWLVYKN